MSSVGTQLGDKQIVICLGAGGVGKTTLSAVIALGLAATGRRVAVVTIDPAKRLAESLGLDDLSNDPLPVDPLPFMRCGLAFQGELSAMMLDVRSTFDELIAELASDPGTRDRILGNRVYQHLCTAVAGSQEYTAVAKLHELVSGHCFDTIVLDTPPSRSAIDFLATPDRLIGFLGSRVLRTLLRPAGSAHGVVGLGLSMLRGITGADLFDDLEVFFGLVGQMLDGFRDQAEAVEELLRDARTGFVLVTSPERTPLEEAIKLGHELQREGMRTSAVIVNRVCPVPPQAGAHLTTLPALSDALGPQLARKVARTYAQVTTLARRDRAAVARLRSAGAVNPICVSDRERDVHDINRLVDLHRELFGATARRTVRGPRSEMALPLAGHSS